LDVPLLISLIPATISKPLFTFGAFDVSISNKGVIRDTGLALEILKPTSGVSV